MGICWLVLPLSLVFTIIFPLHISTSVSYGIAFLDISINASSYGGGCDGRTMLGQERQWNTVHCQHLGRWRGENTNTIWLSFNSLLTNNFLLHCLVIYSLLLSSATSLTRRPPSQKLEWTNEPPSGCASQPPNYHCSSPNNVHNINEPIPLAGLVRRL